MTGLDHRWLLLPLKRGALIALAVGGFHLGTLWVNRSDAVVIATPAALNQAANTAETSAAWPRLMLRLWFLAPQVLPFSR